MLVAHPLSPGERFRQTMRWDQGTSRGGDDPPHLVLAGTYTFYTHYQNIDSQASTSFTICRSVFQLCGLLG
jgi:hypothetical protein